MEKDSAALLLLLFVLVLAMAGVALFVSGSSRRAALAERGRGGDDDGGRQAPAPLASTRGCGAPARGQKLGNWLQGAGLAAGAGRPAAAVLLGRCVFATIVLGAVHAARWPR